MSKRFRDWNIEQRYLFPPEVGDFVPKEHISHFVRELVKTELDLSSISEVYIEERGKPPYDPGMMTALLLYGYCQGERSSRRLSRACEERVDYMAVTGMQKPNFRTICEFRFRHAEALRELFKQVLKLCRAAGLVKLGHVAIDGTKVRANAAIDSGLTYLEIKSREKKLDDEVRGWLEEAARVDVEEDERFGDDKRGDELPEWTSDKEALRKKLAEARGKIEAEQREAETKRAQQEASGEKPKSHVGAGAKALKKERRRYNFTDPDSAVMNSRNGKHQCYNAQCAVDASSQVIVACGVTNDVNDYDELIPMLEQVKKNLKKPPAEVSADAGYCTEENLIKLEKLKINGFIATGRQYSGKLLLRSKKKVKPGTLKYKMYRKLRVAGKRSRYRLRCMTVEPVFGMIKAARGLRQFLLRGLKNVSTEWSLECTAHNLLKLRAARS